MKNSVVKSRFTSAALRVFLWLLILALVMLLFFLWYGGGWREIIQTYRFFFEPKRLRTFVASFGHFSSVVFILLQIGQVVFAPVPGEVTGFVGGFLFGRVWGVVFSTIGLTLGSLLAFGIARFFGLRVVEKIVKKEYIEKFNYFVTHRGMNITFILFLLPGFPKDSLCYILGLTRMKVNDIVFMNVFGRLPGTLMLTLQGCAIQNGKYHEFFWLLAISIGFTAGLYFLRNRIIQGFSWLIRRLFGKQQGQ